MNILNFTPHKIAIAFGVMTIEVEPVGVLARVDTEEVITGRVSENMPIPIVRRTLKNVLGLPSAKNRDPNSIYIVSSMVLEALKAAGEDTTDVFAPDTGPTAIRDNEGKIVAVTRLIGG